MRNSAKNKMKNYNENFKIRKLIGNWKLGIGNSCRLRQAGFTLIETIVALAIFATSIVGLIVVTSQGVADTNLAKNKITASYLAQEGVELVRNLRDNITLSGAGWPGFKEDVIDRCVPLEGCYIDAKNDPLVATPCAAGCLPLRYDTDGFYNHDSGNDSIFTRTIKIEELGSNEVRITVEVLWRQGQRDKRVTMTENLFNWISL